MSYKRSAFHLSYVRSQSEERGIHGEGRDIHALHFNTIQRRTESTCPQYLTHQNTFRTYPALNLIPTLNHPSAPQQQVLNQAKSASGGNSTPWNIGVASGYGLFGFDLGKRRGRWV
jgi:hypothetical protein